MKITITINLDNEASDPQEVWRILSDLAARVGHSNGIYIGDSIPLIDINGNTVGQMLADE